MSRVQNTVISLVNKIFETQEENLEKGARLMADCFEKGGILQAYGVGESISGALDLCQRAGGFAPSKRLLEYSNGEYQDIEGCGTVFMQRVDMRENDVLVFFSNSGRNPLPVDMCLEAQRRGAKVIAVTSLDTSTKVNPKHSCGKNLYQVADVAIDNCVEMGDAMITLENADIKVCAMSTITATTIAQELVYRAAKMMVDDGFEPPILKSRNIDGQDDHNMELKAKCFDRIWHL